MTLENHIQSIGQNMVICGRHCAGVAIDQSKGVLPRCLILETEGRQIGDGCVVVGINPARSAEDERKHYREHGQTYEQITAYWQANVGFRHPYYNKLRRLIDAIGLVGPILWTELVKCENEANTLPPLQTFRTCTQHYLRKELEGIPEHWPLIAVGREAFGSLAYLFANRAVLGLPHPTGSFGLFPGQKNVQGIEKIRTALHTILTGEDKGAAWDLTFYGRVMLRVRMMYE